MDQFLKKIEGILLHKRLYIQHINERKENFEENIFTKNLLQDFTFSVCSKVQKGT